MTLHAPRLDPRQPRTTRSSPGPACRRPCRSTGSPTTSMPPDDAFQVVHDELMLDGNSRQNLATFCQTWEEPRGPRADGPLHRQEHDRQGRVPADRRDRAALRAHARRPVERARRRHNTIGASAHRLVRGLHAGRHGRQVALAGQARRPRASPPTGPTWCAARCRWCGTSSPSTGTSRCARCRCRRATTAWTPRTCSSGSTRTRSSWCRPSG